MGRRDAVQFTLELAAEWRRLGARVTYEPGWESRGNGLTANYEGAEIHHTAFLSSPANPNPAKNTLIFGRPDLRGPLCNSTGPYCTEDDPWIHVIAAHPANHAGASGGRGTAPLPVTGLFNPLVWGHETDYAGNTPMSAGQRKAALIVGRGLTNVLRKSSDWIKAHAETSVTGKWDPGYAPGKTIDMAAFRRDAASIKGPVTGQVAGDIDVAVIKAPNRRPALIGPGYFRELNDEEAANPGPFGAVLNGGDRQYDLWVSMATTGQTVLDFPIQRNEQAGGGVTTLRAQAHWEDYNFRHAAPEETAKLVTAPQLDVDALASRIAGAVQGKADGAAAVPVDAEAVASALAANSSFLGSLAKAVNDDRDRRARDGDPATGPVT